MTPVWTNTSKAMDFTDDNMTKLVSTVVPTVDPYILSRQLPPYTVTIFGFITPTVVLFTMVTNILICAVLLRKNMVSPTNIFLVAMALSDLLTGMIPVPCFFYFFTLGHYKDYVPYGWCHVYNIFVEFIPTIFHTASIWLTVALAVQRYICVCHHTKANQWCTIPNTLKGIAFIYFFAISSQLCRFFEFDHKELEMTSAVYRNQTVLTCTNDFSRWVLDNATVYFNLYFWSRVVFIVLIPCISLVVLNGLLVNAIRKAQSRRRQLLLQNRRSEFRRLQDANGTTMMLVAVVGVFLLVEMPLGVETIILIVQNTFGVRVADEVTLNIVINFTNLLILFSYPINFFIYCGMSKQFRDTFKNLFTPRKAQINGNKAHYTSLNVPNGKCTNAAALVPKETDTKV